MQDMSEVLMLDMGCNGDYPPALRSPGEAARFSFTEQGSHATPTDSSDAAWQIAEVLLICTLLQWLGLLMLHIRFPFPLLIHCQNNEMCLSRDITETGGHTSQK